MIAVALLLMNFHTGCLSSHMKMILSDMVHILDA